MIVKSFSSLRPVLPPVHIKKNHGMPHIADGLEPSQKDRERAMKLGITPWEFVRRDKIVRAEWLRCGFHVGEILIPVKDAMRDKYGTNIRVEGIYKSYHEFHENDKWPEDDEPYILLVKPERGIPDGGRIICTANFLMRNKSNVSAC